MNNIREIEKLNTEELRLGLSYESSWHYEYRKSAWVYIGGLPYELTEGDIICVFSEWGEVEDIHLVRDDSTGRSKGFAFLKYEDSRSAVLCVDNMNGISLLGRLIRVDHKLEYNPPVKRDEEGKIIKESYEESLKDYVPGKQYEDKEVYGAHSISFGVDHYKKETVASNIDNEFEKRLEERIRQQSAARGGNSGSDVKKRSRWDTQNQGTPSSGGVLDWRGKVVPGSNGK